VSGGHRGTTSLAELIIVTQLDHSFQALTGPPVRF
jgi:hypothetical protein